MIENARISLQWNLELGELKDGLGNKKEEKKRLG